MPFADRSPMALLFSDISGFTALTEKLQARGREGAEEIAAVVNRAFRPILRRLRSWGGSVFSFGGDALFVVFPGGGAVRRAVGAAEDIRVLFAERGSVRTSAGPVKLRIKQAIHFGKVHSLHLGRFGSSSAPLVRPVGPGPGPSGRAR